MPVHSQIAKKLLEENAQYIEQKSVLDNICNLNKEDIHKEKLSVNKLDGQGGYMTLLSEGSVLYTDNTIRLYIAKGTLKKWYDSLDDNFEGYVTTGHVDLNAFPVREGYFRKADLKLIKDDQGRYDLLVKPHVNLELSNIKDLIIQDEPFAISSEFMWYPKEIADEDIEEYAKLVVYNMEHGGDWDVPITDTVDIMGFSFVGNPGNAKSGGYEPSMLVRNEEEHLKNKDILEKVLAKLNAEVAEEVKEEEVVEETVEEVTEEVTEDTVEEQPAVPNEVTEALNKAIARIEELEAEKAEKEQEIVDLKAKVDEYEQSEQTVNAQLTKLEKLLTKGNVSVETVEEKVEEKPANIFGRTRFGG